MELEGIQTDHKTQARLWSLTVLDQLSAAIGQSLVLEDLLEAGLTALIEAFDFEAGAVVMRHPAHQLQQEQDDDRSGKSRSERAVLALVCRMGLVQRANLCKSCRHPSMRSPAASGSTWLA